jgi:hypothetical protein
VGRSIEFVLVGTVLASQKNKKTDVTENDEVLSHVGLLLNEPPSTAGLLFI